MTSSITIQLSTPALRKALDLLEASELRSLDELVEALVLRDGPTSPSDGSQAERHTVTLASADKDQLTEPPPERSPLALRDSVVPAGQLQFLTNRFGPLKLATRVLACMSLEGEWPELATFQTHAAAIARRVGRRLRAEDTEQGRRGANRRWVAYPVGEDERAALERFIFSFTLLAGDGSATGPLAQLGVAVTDDTRAVLTERGWGLAVAPSPTLDGDGVSTLSEAEILVLRDCLRRLPDEASAIAEFLKAVRLAAGRQGRVDELLAIWHSDWTSDRAAAERSAMLGRLGELGVLSVTGRGPNARIELVDSVEFERNE